MAHGGYRRRRVAAGRPVGGGRRSKGPGVVEKRPKSVSLKNQIRSIERMLKKELAPEVREAQEKKLDDLRKQNDLQQSLAIERRVFLRNRKIKFFERRKIERGIRRLERMQRTAADHFPEAELSDQLAKLREDLEYVRFFPKSEKYVSLFIGGEDANITERRNALRKQIKSNLVAAAASGKDLEETGSEDDGLLDLSDDDFFLNGSSSDEAEADDEWTDKSTREQASSTSGKAASGMSSDEKNQRLVSARALMPPPHPRSQSTFPRAHHGQTRFASSSGKEHIEFSTSSNTSHSRSGPSSRYRGSSNPKTGTSSNLSSNSDAHKPRRRRRPKKKKQV